MLHVLNRGNILAFVARQHRELFAQHPPCVFHFVRVILLEIDPIELVGASMIQATVNDAFGHAELCIKVPQVCRRADTLAAAFL